MGRLFFRHDLVVRPSAPLTILCGLLHARLGTALPSNISLGTMFEDFHRFTQLTDHSMARKKLGITVNCPVCSTPFWRHRHNIQSGTKLTCSLKCSGVTRRGEGNPFFGKRHSPEILARIAAKNKANPPKTHGPKKGSFKHTPEAKAKMSAALRERWRTKRADMLAYARNGKNEPYDAINPEPRHRFIFTKTQKRDWTGKECTYCFKRSDLVLDHIIPVICGGKNIRDNAQTLCQDCNRWKMRYVDRPMYSALVGSERGSET